LIAVVLAGGYGTRLQGFLGDRPKSLLSVAGRPIVDYTFERLAEIQEIDHVIISTNLRFQQHFREWLESNPQIQSEIIADDSFSEEEKPGAIASLTRVIPKIDDSCLIIAGDNLFTSSLKPMIHTFKDKSSTTVALYDIKDRELAKQYSTATVDAEGRILSFREKPAEPDTGLIGTCIYLFPKSALNRTKEYLIEATDRDNLGRYIEWLCKREPVYGHILGGHWWDIGTIDQYNEANQAMQRLTRPNPTSNDYVEHD
jgi:glucose-1-phosphate thymidylyltransferase